MNTKTRSAFLLINNIFKLLIPFILVSTPTFAAKTFAAKTTGMKEEDAVKFPTITVKEKSEKEYHGYQNHKTKIGKSDQVAKDIPQSLTIINQNLINDRNAFSFKEAISNVAGLSPDSLEAGRTGDNFSIRGFAASSDLYLDGIRDNAQYNRDTFNVERIEVLRGASSMLFGRGSTGGVVNQVMKEPELNLDSSAKFTVGNNSFFRESADVNKKIDTKSAVRINVVKTDSNSSREIVKTDSFGIAPSLKFGINTDDEVLLSYSHLQYRTTPDYGIPIPSNVQYAKPISVPHDNFYGVAGIDRQKDSVDIFTANWNKKIDKNNKITTTFRHNNTKRDLHATAPRVVNSSTVGRVRQARGAIENSSTLQTNYNSKFETSFLKHDSLLGAEYLVEQASRWSYLGSGSNTNNNTDLLNPNPYSQSLTDAESLTQKILPTHFKDKNFGIYAQDLIQFLPQWRLLIGARYDNFKANYNSDQTKYARNDKALSYRSGLLYQPDSYTTYYISRGTSFNLSGDIYSAEAISVTRAGKTSPEKTINTEIGAKWELLDGNLSLRTALFRSEKTNERNIDPAINDSYVLSGRRHTDGLEIESSGHPFDNWEIFTNISFLESKIDKSTNPYASGLTSVNAPKFSGNFWNTYRFTENWKIGAGVDFISERLAYSTSPSNGVFLAPVIRRIPSYAKFDTMIQWNNKQFTAKVNVINIFDKEYFESIHLTGNQALPGTGRAIQFTLGYKF